MYPNLSSNRINKICTSSTMRHSTRCYRTEPIYRFKCSYQANRYFQAQYIFIDICKIRRAKTKQKVYQGTRGIIRGLRTQDICAYEYTQTERLQQPSSGALVSSEQAKLDNEHGLMVIARSSIARVHPARQSRSFETACITSSKARCRQCNRDCCGFSVERKRSPRTNR